MSFIASEQDVTVPLCALSSLLQQNALEKHINSTANVPGNLLTLHMFSSCLSPVQRYFWSQFLKNSERFLFLNECGLSSSAHLSRKCQMCSGTAKMQLNVEKKKICVVSECVGFNVPLDT